MPTFMQREAAVASAAPWLAGSAALESRKAPAWVKALRATGAEAFAQTGLPTPAWEGWQYTNLRSLSQMQFHYAAEGAVFDVKKIPPRALENAGRIVVVNGQLQPQLSDLPAGVSVISLMEAVEKGMAGLESHIASLGDLALSPFKALNTAYLRDGFVLTVKDGAEIEKPLEVLFYNIGGDDRPPALYPRLLYWLGKGSGLTLLERHMGEGAYFTDLHTGVILEAGAHLKFYRMEEESPAACHFSLTTLQQHRDSSFEGFILAVGGQLARQEFQGLLIDSGILSRVGGIYLLQGQQCHDFTVLADHFEPDGTSVQNFRGAVDDQARAVFQGKIHVRRSAQKADGNQSHHALLLSESAEASFKPELEIYADDVKCRHGATSGRLDESALFYLRSRGIPEAEARSLLVQSFLNETLAMVTSVPVRGIFEQKVQAWLAR